MQSFLGTTIAPYIWQVSRQPVSGGFYLTTLEFHESIVVEPSIYYEHSIEWLFQGIRELSLNSHSQPLQGAWKWTKEIMNLFDILAVCIKEFHFKISKDSC